jgi:hypothetical protein
MSPRSICAPTWEHTTNGWVAKENYGGRDKKNQGYGARSHEQQKASKISRIGAQKRGSAITDPRQWLITKSKQVARNALVAFSTFKKSPYLAIQRPYREVPTATCSLECHKRPP